MLEFLQRFGRGTKASAIMLAEVLPPPTSSRHPTPLETSTAHLVPPTEGITHKSAGPSSSAVDIDTQVVILTLIPDPTHAVGIGNREVEEGEESGEEGDRKDGAAIEEEGVDSAEGEVPEEIENAGDEVIESAEERIEREGKSDENEAESEEEVEGETPGDGDYVEEEVPADRSEDELVSKEKDQIKVTSAEPDTEETPVDERTMRRITRRSRQVDELVAATRPRKLKFGSSVDKGEADEAEEERYVAERKRKGKQMAKLPTKKPRTASPAVENNEPS